MTTQTKGPESTAVVEQNGAPEPNHHHYSTRIEVKRGPLHQDIISIEQLHATVYVFRGRKDGTVDLQMDDATARELLARLQEMLEVT